ncbi:uncharacterized protein LOC132200170 isoform X2 [Neocloeon triangulifer]|uniref:uncharacterized protein LOC132200170 isoform X2 n=1 Tax=Neocloeon triangulifer TaxID=2078957 RepID=UPI00286ECB04|nr:uncharacterized protein LOC132200170 isoform X2 [Neocloeon triangulifer]
MLAGASAATAGPSGVRTVSGGPLGAPSVPDQSTLQQLARCAELRAREERLLREVAAALGHGETQRHSTPTHRVNIAEVEDLYLRCTSDSMYILDTSHDITQQLGQQEVEAAAADEPENYNQKRRSSTELYREAAAIWGLTCRMSDSCRCLDCQSRYFDCDFEDEERPPDLAAGGPILFDHVLNHPVTCSLL